DRVRNLEHHAIPEDLDYGGVANLSREGRERFVKYRPSTVGQAGRLSGVTPSDIGVLLVHLEKRKRAGAPNPGAAGAREPARDAGALKPSGV
ncbi:MAG: tRNA uridine-5-carboxymethylaminomethyl(34) synthesis enzyme MnmG, partial [Chloroflexota bacterium]